VFFTGNPMAGPVIIEKAQFCYNDMKITDKCPFSEDLLQNLEDPAAEVDTQMEYSSD
jgi:hypothetical protein